MRSSGLRAVQWLIPAVLVAASGCAGTRAPATATSVVGPTTAAAPSAADSVVWTAAENTPIHTRVGVIPLEYPLMRLDVLGRTTSGLVVTCRQCEPAISGYVDDAALVRTVYPPEIAASLSLAEFALSVRDAALRHDLDALRPVMAPDFTYDFVGIQTPEAAFDVWRSEGFRSLDEVPGLLDRGVATDDNVLWVSPPVFLTDLGYRGLRLGFRRRPDGRWEWLFLIRGISQ